MHSIKTTARRLAWRTDSYNPFARSRSHTSYPGDEETGLQRGMTAQSGKGPNHRRFFSEGANAPDEHHEQDGIHRAFTLPETAEVSPDDERPAPTKQSTEQSQQFGQDSEHTTGGISNQTQKTDKPLVDKSKAADPASVPNEENGARKRKGKFVMPWKKDADDYLANGEKEDKKKNKKIPQKFTVWGQIKVVIFGSWVNLLLVFIPVGFAVHYANLNPFAVFFLNFIAIVPLAGMLSYATEEIALRTGETLGGLLNATFGNAVELIVAILALTKDQILIVQTSLVGSMLSNLLLVMGMCFFFGGISRVEQYFNITVAQTAASLAALAIGSLLVPTAFDAAQANLGSQSTQEAQISRGTAIILLVVYGCYLLFQLKTHAEIYNEPSKKAPKRHEDLDDGSAKRGIAQIAAGSAASSGGQINNQSLVRPQREGGVDGDDDSDDDDDEGEVAQISFIGALLTLAISTALVALLADYMTTAINGITATGKIGTEFVGLILLPIVGNAAEHATAVTVACKDKMDLAIGVAIGSSIQIALLVLPLSVVLGWIIGTPTTMTLDFDYFQITVLFVAILLVNYLIQDGKSHWLEGVLLMATYIIIAVAAWVFPNPPNLGTG